MIDHLDRVLRTLFLRRVDGITSETQVRFQAPDDDWRAAVANLQVNGEPAEALNVYLTEVRQNRERRSNARTRSIENGHVVEELANSWINCQYLISAWSPATTEQVEPTPDEHALLYRTLEALQHAAPINPSGIYPPDSSALAAIPELIRNTDLPTETAPPEGFGKLAEFWGTMGAGHRWKPAIQLVVALPVASGREAVGRPVVTQVLELQHTGQPGTRAALVRIAGTVRDAAQDPVDHADVMLESREGVQLDASTTGPTGRFTFDVPSDVLARPAAYQLHARMSGFEDKIQPIDLRAGTHDVVFSTTLER